MSETPIIRPWWQYIALAILGALTIAAAGIAAYTTYEVLHDGQYKATVVLLFGLLAVITAFPSVLFLIVLRSGSRKK